MLRAAELIILFTPISTGSKWNDVVFLNSTNYPVLNGRMHSFFPNGSAEFLTDMRFVDYYYQMNAAFNSDQSVAFFFLFFFFCQRAIAHQYH